MYVDTPHLFLLKCYHIIIHSINIYRTLTICQGLFKELEKQVNETGSSEAWSLHNKVFFSVLKIYLFLINSFLLSITWFCQNVFNYSLFNRHYGSTFLPLIHARSWWTSFKCILRTHRGVFCWLASWSSLLYHNFSLSSNSVRCFTRKGCFNNIDSMIILHNRPYGSRIPWTFCMTFFFTFQWETEFLHWNK